MPILPSFRFATLSPSIVCLLCAHSLSTATVRFGRLVFMNAL